MSMTQTQRTEQQSHISDIPQSDQRFRSEARKVQLLLAGKRRNCCPRVHPKSGRVSLRSIPLPLSPLVRGSASFFQRSSCDEESDRSLDLDSGYTERKGKTAPNSAI